MSTTTSTDRLAEAHYASSDPQLANEEQIIKDIYLEELGKLRDKIDDAIGFASAALECTPSSRIRNVRDILYDAMDMVEMEM